MRLLGRPSTAPSGPPSGASGAVPGGPIVDLHEVAKRFETEAGPFYALHRVDLHIERGEFVAVVGKSGSGKSTLLNMIAGIDRPSEGEVWVCGTAIHHLSENELARWRGRTVGVVFQFFQLLPALSVVENVMLPMDFCHVHAGRERYRYAVAMLEAVGMAEHARKLPFAISGGEQQRVAIARALANDPPILLADEPTGNLDSRTAATVFALFERLVDAGKTIVMVTHDMDLADRAQRRVHLVDGRVVAPGEAPPRPVFETAVDVLPGQPPAAAG